MKKCEKLFEKLKEDGKEADIFLVMHRCCPSDCGMKDGGEKCASPSYCFQCWMDEVEE